MADSPLKWLLAELPSYIEAPALAALMARYDANKAAYARQIKIRVITRQIAIYERRGNTTAAIRRWQAKLDQLTRESPQR